LGNRVFIRFGKRRKRSFLCLKTLSEQIKTVHGVFFGHNSSVKLEKVLRESVEASAAKNSAVECVIRFLCLLVEKNCFRYIDLILQKIEQALDEQNGVLAVTVETATPVDESFEKELSQKIKERTGAANVKMKTRVRPELLGGYLLRIGGHYVDASLKGAVKKYCGSFRRKRRL